MASNKKESQGSAEPTLSLSELATRAVLAEMPTGDRSSELGYLGPMGPRGRIVSSRQLPERWSQIHVLDRLEEAFETIISMRVKVRPQSYGSAMPSYPYERADLIAQVETELERTMAEQNRVRLPPSPVQITRMDQTFRWIVAYLEPYPEVAQAVQLAALWAVLKVDVAKRCRARGLNPQWFHARKMHGLNIITIRLLRRKVPVS